MDPDPEGTATEKVRRTAKAKAIVSNLDRNWPKTKASRQSYNVESDAMKYGRAKFFNRDTAVKRGLAKPLEDHETVMKAAIKRGQDATEKVMKPRAKGLIKHRQSGIRQ